MKRSGFGFFGVPQPFYNGADGGGGGGAADTKDVITFKNNDELEALVKGRVDSAVALAVKKAGGGTSDADKAELERLRKIEADRELKDKEARGQYDAALKSQEESIRKELEPKIQAEKDRADAAQKQLEAKVIGQSVAEAAGKMNAVDPAQVRQLLAADFRMDDRYEAIVVDGEGKQRFVAGKPMTPEQRVEEFLKANPHMVRSTAGDGGGAAGSKTAKTGDVSAIQAAEAKVKALEDEALRTGQPRALAAHAAAVKELAALKGKSA